MLSFPLAHLHLQLQRLQRRLHAEDSSLAHALSERVRRQPLPILFRGDPEAEDLFARLAWLSVRARVLEPGQLVLGALRLQMMEAGRWSWEDFFRDAQLMEDSAQRASLVLQVLAWLQGETLQKMVNSGLAWMIGEKGGPEELAPTDLPTNLVERVRGWAEAVGLAHEGGVAEALARLQRLEGLVEPDLELWLLQAQLSFNLGKVAEAEELLRQCLQLYPYPPVRRLRASIAESRGDFRSAILDRMAILERETSEEDLRQQLEEDLEHWPNHGPAWYLLGRISAEEEDYVAATPLLRRALSAEGLSLEEQAVAWSLLSFCLKQQKEPWLEAADRALMLDPTLMDALVLRAEALSEDLPEACLELCEKLLAIDPEQAGLLWLRARTLAALGRREEAAAELEQVLIRMPEKSAELSAPPFAHPLFDSLRSRAEAGEFEEEEEEEEGQEGPKLHPHPTMLSRTALRELAAFHGFPWAGFVPAQEGRPEHLRYTVDGQVVTWTESCALDIGTLWVPEGMGLEALQPLLLPSSDPTFSLAALQSHLQLQPAELDRLKAALQDENPRLRWTAAWVLASRAPTLLEAQTDTDPSVQVLLDLIADKAPSYAHHPMAEAPPDPAPLLRRVLLSRGDLIRRAWAQGWLLARVILPTERTAFEMIWFIQSSGAATHNCKLHYIEHYWLQERFVQLHGEGKEAVAEGLTDGFEALPELIERLQRSTTARSCIEALRAVITLLGEVSEPEAAAALHPLCRHPERAVRLELLRSLAWRNWRDSLALVLPMFGDEDEEIQVLARRVAEMLRERGAPEPRFLRSPPVRAWMPPREEFFRVVDPSVELEQLLHATRHLVWEMAISDEEQEFLHQVQWKRGEEELLMTLYPTQELLLLRGAGAQLLGELEAEIRLWNAEDLPSHPDPAFALGALGLIQPGHPQLPELLQQALDSADSSVRYRAVLAAVGLSLPGIQETLERLQREDPEAEVRAVAANALRVIGE